MKKFLMALIVLIHTTAYGGESPTEDIRLHIEVLSSDKFAGRLSGSSGGQEAGEYMANEFNKIGLLPAAAGSYFQPFHISTKKIGKDNRLSISKEQFKLFEDYVPLTVCPSGEITGKTGFADVDGDFRGKVAVVRYHESAKEDWLASKIKADEEGGAVALFILKKDLYSDYTVWEELISPALHARWEKSLKEDLSHFLRMKVTQKMNMTPPVTGNIPCIMVRENLPILGAELNSAYEVTLKVDITEDKISARNVIGYLPGKGKKKDEVVIIGAHYDHLGLDSKGRPFPGADDNASGVAAMLDVAKRLAEQGPLKRDVVFIAFDGEEGGLVGSRYYTNHPLYPLDKTILMINMDAIGRNEPEAIHLLGSLRSPDVRKVTGGIADDIGIQLLDDIEFAFKYGSDHYSFYEKGIPAIDLTSSYHEDFHRITDTPEKVNVDKVSKIADLVYRLALEVSNSEVNFQKPLQVDVPFPEQR